MKKTIAILMVILLLLSGCKAGKEPSNAAPATPVEDAATVDTDESKDSATESTDLEETSGQIRFWELVDEMTTEQAQEILSRKPESDRYSPLTPEERMALYQLFCEQVEAKSYNPWCAVIDLWFSSPIPPNTSDYVEKYVWETLNLESAVQENVSVTIFDSGYLADLESNQPDPLPIAFNFLIKPDSLSITQATQILKDIYRHCLSLKEVSYAEGAVGVLLSSTDV